MSLSINVMAAARVPQKCSKPVFSRVCLPNLTINSRYSTLPGAGGTTIYPRHRAMEAYPGANACAHQIIGYGSRGQTG